MNLSIGSTTIEITSCTRKRDLTRGAYLDISIPKENIGCEDLQTLLTDNKETIVITEADETTTEYIGFNSLYSIMIKDGTYHVEQLCASELEFQLNFANQKIAEQTEQVAFLEEANAMQLEAIETILLEVIPCAIEEAVTSALGGFAVTGPTTEGDSVEDTEEPLVEE